MPPLPDHTIFQIRAKTSEGNPTTSDLFTREIIINENTGEFIYKSTGGGLIKPNSNLLSITQASHGFAVGTPVSLAEEGFYPSSAALIEESQVCGIVSEVIDSNTFELRSLGLLTGMTGLTAGLTYYLSEDAGGYTSTKPTGVNTFVKELFKAVSNTEAIVMIGATSLENFKVGYTLDGDLDANNNNIGKVGSLTFLRGSSTLQTTEDGNGKQGLKIKDNINTKNADIYITAREDGTSTQVGDVIVATSIDGVDVKYHAAPLSHVPSPIRIIAATGIEGAPEILDSTTVGALYTNEGATEETFLLLPPADIGATYSAVVQNTHGIRFVVQQDNTVGMAGEGAVSGLFGYIRSTDIRSAITVTKINSSDWIATKTTGNWSTNE